MPKYILTSKALEDIADIWNYTFEVWSENQADKYYLLLTNAFEEIEYEPKLGKKYNKISKEILGFSVEKHIIFYQRTKDLNILIIRVLHQSMDIENILK